MPFAPSSSPCPTALDGTRSPGPALPRLRRRRPLDRGADRAAGTAAAHGTIVVAPDGAGRTWQLDAHGTDATFIDALVDRLASTSCVDLHRVYAAGFSAGAAFTVLYSCARPDRIAAIATVAADFQLGCHRPMPIIAFHGTKDPAVPFVNGGVGASLPGVKVRGTELNLRDWAALDHCTPTPLSQVLGSEVTRQIWTGLRGRDRRRALPHRGRRPQLARCGPRQRRRADHPADLGHGPDPRLLRRPPARPMTEPEATPHAKLAPMPGNPKRKRLIIIGAVVGVVLLVVVVAPFVYIHFFNGNTPKKLSLSSGGGGTTTTAPAAIAPLAGTWTVGTGSTAGYRVDEVLFGQSTTAVGRTKAVTGSMTIAGTTVTTATFTVDMTTITSDKSQRDRPVPGHRRHRPVPARHVRDHGPHRPRDGAGRRQDDHGERERAS